MTPPAFAFPEIPPEWVLPLPAAWEHDGVRTIRAIPYVSQPGFRPVELDAHLPAAATGPTPAVIFIHGGAWLMGSRSMLGPMYAGMRPDAFTAIARLGIAVISIDYRMSGEAIFPAQLHDTAAAHRYVVARAADLNIDPARIAVWGESAGGHLAMLLAFNQAGTGNAGNAGHAGSTDLLGMTGAPVTSPPLAALVDWCGVADLGTVMGLPMPGPSAEAKLLGADPLQAPNLVAFASPITYVDASTPTLIVHGTGDAIVPIAQSEQVAASIRELGGGVETLWIEEANHAWLGSADHAAIALQATTDYLVRMLAP